MSIPATTPTRRRRTATQRRGRATCPRAAAGRAGRRRRRSGPRRPRWTDAQQRRVPEGELHEQVQDYGMDRIAGRMRDPEMLPGHAEQPVVLQNDPPGEGRRIQRQGPGRRPLWTERSAICAESGSSRSLPWVACRDAPIRSQDVCLPVRRLFRRHVVGFVAEECPLLEPVRIAERTDRLTSRNRACRSDGGTVSPAPIASAGEPSFGRGSGLAS